MKVLTKIFLVLAFLIMLCLVVLTIGIHGNEAYYEQLADIEEAAVAGDLDGLNRAEAAISLARANLNAAEVDVTTIDSVSKATIAELSLRETASKTALDLIKTTSQLQYDMVARLAGDATVQEFAAASKKLADRTSEINTSRVNVDAAVASALKDVQQRRANLAYAYEDFRAKELSAYLLQETLASRISLRNRYRYVSETLQKEVGDNGPNVVGARVSNILGETRIEMNRGSDDGVELYQYFNVMRNGRTIATVRVDSLSNRTALAYLEPGTADAGIKLQVNDVLQRRKVVNAGYNRGTMGGY